MTLDGSFKTDACHSNCNCSQEDPFDPLCGKDGITYFSPCYAGCSVLDKTSDPWVSSKCSNANMKLVTYTKTIQQFKMLWQSSPLVNQYSWL